MPTDPNSPLITAPRTTPPHRFGPQPGAADSQELLAARDAAWRAWFGNDPVAFERVVPDELIALGWDGGDWTDRDQTLARMAEFATTGMTIDRLEFPRNEFQHYGDVALIYSSFRLALRDPAGQCRETVGRATEVFVRRAGRWVHTGWHLDTVGS